MNIQTVTFENTSFVVVTKPGELDIKYLKNNFGFNQLQLDDYLNKTQIPKIEVMKDYTLIVLDFPSIPHSGTPSATKDETKTTKGPIDTLLNLPPVALSSVSLPQFLIGDKKKRIFTSQLDIFIGKDYVVVIHDETLPLINEMFSICQKTLNNRREYMSQGAVFLAYRIIDALVDTSFPILNELTSDIDKIDKDLEHKPTADTIENISVTRRNIVVFQTMIKPILPIFRQIEEGVYKNLNGTMQQYWGNVLDHLQKIWDRLEDSRELIEGISESNESLLTYRNNEIVKFLTVITSIAFPFVIVNNLYSMNVVGLPFATHPGIVWVLFGVIFVSGIFTVIYFKYRNWL